ncbi:MAG: DNA-binding domain-containing protein [Arenimonas sp.]
MSLSLLDMQRDFLTSLRKQEGAQIRNALLEKPVSKIGLQTYIHAYSSRLTEALDNDHPCLGEYLGDTLWHEMCIGYIDKYPSQFTSLRNFGDLLPEYLRHEDAFKKNPEIAELAQLEREFLNCFDAPDAMIIEFTELLGISEQAWPILQLGFHPSLRLLSQEHNAMAVWQAIRDKQVPPVIRQQANHWILWRDMDRVTSFRSLENEERNCLQHFLDGGNFSQFCEYLMAGHNIEDVPIVALAYIKSWYAEGWVISPTNAQKIPTLLEVNTPYSPSYKHSQ